ncbi:hypothetical protein ACFQZI_16590 [Mucilaginibacter lutimaris]|uniref:Uncharacterized protein n=1 Tax=Mucilaginibacter lutimaris TaxID=931629 RepID=A0ABW2ZJW4_9SPHI
MKNSKKSATHKLVSRFDKELMSILMNDLKTLKARNLKHSA